MSLREDTDTRCELAIKTIETLGDHKLGIASRARLMKHLEECPECREYFEKMTAVIEILENLPRVDAPEDFTRKVIEAVLEHFPDMDAIYEGEGVHKRMWIAGAVFGVSVALGLAVVKHFVEHEEGGDGDVIREKGLIAAT